MPSNEISFDGSRKAVRGATARIINHVHYAVTTPAPGMPPVDRRPSDRGRDHHSALAMALPPENSPGYWKQWTPQRVAKLLLGPEQIACYFAFSWAGLMLMNRYREVMR